MSTVFSASLEHLHEMLRWICNNTEVAFFSKKNKEQIELAAEEAIVNIIKHGYGKNPGTIEIECFLTDDEDVELSFKDKGIPCNPLENTHSEGGSGVKLILALMDNVSYQRQGQYNILTMRKRVTTQMSTTPE